MQCLLLPPAGEKENGSLRVYQSLGASLKKYDLRNTREETAKLFPKMVVLFFIPIRHAFAKCEKVRV